MARAKLPKADPSTGDRIYDDDESEFLRAMAAYIARTGRRFPSWTETLGVVKALGYSRPVPPVLTPKADDLPVIRRGRRPKHS